MTELDKAIGEQTFLFGRQLSMLRGGGEYGASVILGSWINELTHVADPTLKSRTRLAAGFVVLADVLPGTDRHTSAAIPFLHAAADGGETTVSNHNKAYSMIMRFTDMHLSTLTMIDTLQTYSWKTTDKQQIVCGKPWELYPQITEPDKLRAFQCLTQALPEVLFCMKMTGTLWLRLQNGTAETVAGPIKT